ncbi:MAG: TRIC cation channel family protein [Actinomyces sp.]|nr:TRIC cation channel family protein [Actinomyces sp.]
MNNDTHRLLRIAMHLLDALNNSLPEVFRAIDLMGVLLNGILGGKVARERNFDAVGFCILAIMTALAGGMIRDLLLTTRTGAPVAITDPYYLWFAIIGALVAMAFRMDSRVWSVLLVIADGMVLGCWSATGAIKTLDAGFAIMPAILLGIMTAIGGGMVRDISAGLVPRVFGGNNLYATPRVDHHSHILSVESSASGQALVWRCDSPINTRFFVSRRAGGRLRT